MVLNHHLTLVMLPVSVLTMQLTANKKHYTMRDTVVKPLIVHRPRYTHTHTHQVGINYTPAHIIIYYYTAYMHLGNITLC